MASRMTFTKRVSIFLCVFLCGAVVGSGQASSEATTFLNGSVRLPKAGRAAQQSTAVVWLDPIGHSLPSEPGHSTRFTLLQKNRMFSPHLLVVPVGSVVSFPNADPFFHNVFSLFNGKRFDLGLYEAGSTKEVTFSRAGVSYIFCNIHPEMSAVIVTLSTSLYSVADRRGEFQIPNVPTGDYEMHIWIEGASQPDLNRMTRRVHLTQESGDLGLVEAPSILIKSEPHSNMYGQPYDRDVKSPY